MPDVGQAGLVKKDPYAHLSDDDLKKMLSGHEETNDSYEHLSDEDLKKMLSAPEEPKGNGYVEGALRSLPMIGGVAGAGAGFLAPVPGGTIAGAGIGGYLGKATENLARGLLGSPYDQSVPKGASSVERMAKLTGSAATSGAEQASFEGGGQILNKAAAPFVKDFAEGAEKYYLTPKPNASQITEAATRLGTRATPAMTSSNPIYQKMESSLAQSPGPMGMLTRSEVNPTYETMQSTAKDILSKGSGADRFQAGESMKRGFLGEAESQLGKAGKKFEALKQELPHVAANPKQVQGTIERIINHPAIKTDAGGSLQGMANRLADTLGNLKTADEINAFKTSIGKIHTIDANEQRFLGDAYRAVDDLVQNSVKGEAKNLSRMTGDAGIERQGAGLLKTRANANKAWNSATGKVREMGDQLGVSIRRGDSSTQMLGKLRDNISSESLARKAINPADQQTVNFFAQKYPQMFKTASKVEISNIGKRSIADGKVNLSTMFQRLKNVPENVQKQMFGADYQKLKDLQTVYEARPAMSGASGTSQEAETSEGLLNPLRQIGRAGQYGLYKGVPAAIRGAKSLGSAMEGGGSAGLINQEVGKHIAYPMAKDFATPHQIDKNAITEMRQNYPSMTKDMDDETIDRMMQMPVAVAGMGSIGGVGGKGLMSNIVPMEQMAERRGLVRPSLENQQAQNALDNLSKASDPKDIEGLGLIAKQKMGLLENAPEKPRDFESGGKVFRDGSYKVRTTKDNQYTGQKDYKISKDGEWLGTRTGTRVSPEDALSEYKKKDNILRLSNADDEAFKQPAHPGDSHEASMEGIRARYGDNPPENLLKAEELSKKGHDEPYAFGDITNAVWGNNKKAVAAGEWNRPMPFPTKTGDLKGVLGKGVIDGSGSDPFMWMDDKYKSTKRALDANYDKPLDIHTRSDLIAKDDYLEKINPDKHKIFIHIPSENEHAARILEPGAASIKRRMSAAQKMADAGYDVTVMHDDLRPNFVVNRNGMSSASTSEITDQSKQLNNLFNADTLSMRREYALKNVKFEKNPITLDKDRVKKLESVLGTNLAPFFRGKKK